MCGLCGGLTPVRPGINQGNATLLLAIYFGNPSSIYACGQEARKGLEEARSQIAVLIGGREEEIVFTSGGAEGPMTPGPCFAE